MNRIRLIETCFILAWICTYIVLFMTPSEIEPANNKAIAAGTSIHYVINTDGTVVGWGESYGNLYDSIIIPYPFVFRRTIMKNADSIYTNEIFSAIMVIDRDNGLWGWGKRLLLTNSESADSPVKIMDDIASVAIGTSHVAVLKVDGTILVWGSNLSGQMAFGYADSKTYGPHEVMNHANFIYVEHEKTFAVDHNNNLYVWGGYDYPSTPTYIMPGVKEIRCNWRTTDSFLVLTTDGEIHTLDLAFDIEKQQFSEINVGSVPIMTNVQTLTDYGFITNEGIYKCIKPFSEEMSFLEQSDSIACVGNDSLIVMKDGKIYSKPWIEWFPIVPFRMSATSTGLRNLSVLFFLYLLIKGIYHLHQRSGNDCIADRDDSAV